MKPADPAFEPRVRDSFAQQGLMRTLGATMERVEPGKVEISMSVTDAISQHNCFAHGGAIASLADAAAGFAAMSLLPSEKDVLTIELKINFLSPVRSSVAVARGRVIKAGRTIIVAQVEVLEGNEGAKLLAVATSTLMTVAHRP